MNDFLDGVKNFIAFFTVKHITVLVFLAVILVLVCQPHQFGGDSTIGQTCSDASCPFPRKDAQAQTETVAQENWSFVLTGSWEDHEPSVPTIKTVRYNPDNGCGILLIKEESGPLTLGEYANESLLGFKQNSVDFHIVKLTELNKQPFIYLEGSLRTDTLKSWNSTKDGFGYSFNCFCHSPKDVCQEVANTLEIK